MPIASRVLIFSGSARIDSYNQKLAAIAARGVTERGATATLISLSEFPMPIFNEDIEKSDPSLEHVENLKALLMDHEAVVIACPEYNSSITPLLKNTIDWTSRPDAKRAGLVCWRGKVAGLISASPGVLGGLRGLTHVRSILNNIGVFVVPDQRAIGKAHEAFKGDSLRNQTENDAIKAIGAQVAEIATRLKTN